MVGADATLPLMLCHCVPVLCCHTHPRYRCVVSLLPDVPHLLMHQVTACLPATSIRSVKCMFPKKQTKETGVKHETRKECLTSNEQIVQSLNAATICFGPTRTMTMIASRNPTNHSNGQAFMTEYDLFLVRVKMFLLS